jgi:3-methyladenine DNA glycosylase/8-oxoguanine DNA glycosylase
LRPLGFSYQKSRAIVEAARAVCNGQLDLESLSDVPDDKAVERLEQLRGVTDLP